MNNIIRAAHFADICHKSQVRKFSGRPYIQHLANCAGRAILLENTNEDIIMSAWLHETIRKCKISSSLLFKEFGPVVYQYVWELTNHAKVKEDPKIHRDSIDHKYLRLTSREAKQLQLIDRIDNLQEVQLAPLDFREMYARESVLLLNSIGDCDAILAKELSEAIDNL